MERDLASPPSTLGETTSPAASATREDGATASKPRTKRVKLSLTLEQAEQLQWAAGQMLDDMSAGEYQSLGKTRKEHKDFFAAMKKLAGAIREATK